MSRVTALLALCLVFPPLSAEAIQLHWSSGASDLTVTSATRCMLVVRADSAEQVLPQQWRLLWVADSSAIGFVALDSLAACEADDARVFGIDAPSTFEDSSENVITARFCSAGSATASTASYLVDVPGGAHGKLKVVALDRADTSTVLQSQEATFNGGLAGDYPAVILCTSTVHQSLTFQIRASGLGLGAARALAIISPDGLWQLPLSISSQADTAITATAPVAALVPACLLRATLEGGATAVASVAADPPPPALDPQWDNGCERYFQEIIPGADTHSILPRNVSLVPGGWSPSGVWMFHLFFTRENQFAAAGDTKRNIGHVVSNNLKDWDWPRSHAQDTTVIRTRGGRFDSLHVFAPAVVLKGLTYYMFYVGADKDNNLRIGLATSTDLVNWTQGDSVLDATAIFQQPDGKWLDPSPQGYDFKAQLGDPFVMPDPTVPGDWLMYFTTVASGDSLSQMIVGVARSHGNFELWGSAFALWNTHHSWKNRFRADSAYVVQAPHAFFRNGRWWLLSTANEDSIWAQSNDLSPIDTLNAGAGWTAPQKLYQLVYPYHANLFYYWHQSAHLQFLKVNSDTISFLAAFCTSPTGVVITKMVHYDGYLFGTTCDSMTAGVGKTPATVVSPSLSLCGASPARSQVGLRVELPVRMRVYLAMYDVLGRRVRTLLDEELPAGATQVAWDGRDRAGSAVGSGVYFARLTTAGSRHAVRVPLIR